MFTSIETNIPGLYIYENIIDEKLQYELIKEMDSNLWNNQLSRAVQHFGYIYPYDQKVTSANHLMPTTPIPELYLSLITMLKNNGILATDYNPDQLIINEYQAGQGIAAHTDNIVFDDTIVSISLLSVYNMDFISCDDSTIVKTFPLTVGSVLIMQGEARYKYKHEIKKRKTDIINGKKITRGRRISLTFRKIKDNKNV